MTCDYCDEDDGSTVALYLDYDGTKLRLHDTCAEELQEESGEEGLPFVCLGEVSNADG